ncbi:uncharacterized protein EV422DRAFT_513679 [Fimicolochytrium jonesii]|uniref:uncharacterized protein n=1 Tax=Fimicolochytrium jonesii TaxID=1396493 RepID=UPI0022FE48DC|nr:uncharacterized protein EV422DRAFT_513679 [Fimicolochytrium jonesii]KAI8825641.1 hypothetical protein EV422DRAFT_513679 [Fimicolochytrium jonesii]
MANSSAKKLLVTNAARLKSTLQIHLIVVALYSLYRIAFRWSSFSIAVAIGFLLVNGIFYYLYGSLKSAAEPSVDETGAVKHAGQDLNDESGLVVPYMFDVIYVGWFVLVSTAIISEKFWWTYLIIPLFAVYKIWQKVAPMLGRGGGSGFQPTPAASGKKQKKQTVKYARG